MSDVLNVKNMFDDMGIKINETVSGENGSEKTISVIDATGNQLTLEQIKVDAIKCVNVRYYSIISNAAFMTTDEGYMVRVTNEHLDFMNRFIQMMEMNGDTYGTLYLADNTSVSEIPLETIKSVYHQMLKCFNYLWFIRFDSIRMIKEAKTVEEILSLDISFN